jgi:hypothetical protein
MLEILNLNDVHSVNITLESLSQIHADKMRDGKVRKEFQNLHLIDNQSIFTEQQRKFLKFFVDCIKLKVDYGYK